MFFVFFGLCWISITSNIYDKFNALLLCETFGWNVIPLRQKSSMRTNYDVVNRKLKVRRKSPSTDGYKNYNNRKLSFCFVKFEIEIITSKGKVFFCRTDQMIHSRCNHLELISFHKQLIYQFLEIIISFSRL